jgi:hypothetical protein
LNDAKVEAAATITFVTFVAFVALVSLFAAISDLALITSIALVTLVTFRAGQPLRTGGTGRTSSARCARWSLRACITFRTGIAAASRQCKRNPQNEYWNESHGLPSQPSFDATATLNQRTLIRHQITLRRIRVRICSIRLLRLKDHRLALISARLACPLPALSQP